MLPKYDELCVNSSLFRPHIIIICESWLTELVQDNQIALPNYSTSYRKDRCDGRRGGGVVVYVHESLFSIRINPPNMNRLPIEDVWIQFPALNLLIIALYIPPNLPANDLRLINDYVCEDIEQFLETEPNFKVIIAGDLNNFSTTEIEDTFNLIQVVESPTRGTAILDKILGDKSLIKMYRNVLVGPTLDNSDHKSVLMSSSKPPISYHVQRVYDFRNSHIEKFRKFLRSYPWHSFFSSPIGIEEKCNSFYEVIHEAISLIPYTLVPVTPKDKAWITPLIKSLINKRYDAYREKNFVLYNHYKRKVKQLIEESKQKWIHSSKKSSNGLWKICNDTLNKSRSAPLASLIHSFSTPTAAAEKINEEFCKNFAPPPDWVSLTSRLDCFHRCSEKWAPEISIPQIASMLKNLKVNKAPGYDGLPARLLLEAYEELSPPICHLISLSIEERTVPSKWKVANVTPIPKKRNPTIQDLRPISILPITSKLMEKCVLASIKEKLLSLYGSSQFGFRPNCSTELAHIRAHDFITYNLDSIHCVAVLILSFDMQKAFDYLQHDSLILSLAEGDLPREFLDWCISFLRNRVQRVRINDSALSSLQSVSSGAL